MKPSRRKSITATQPLQNLFIKFQAPKLKSQRGTFEASISVLGDISNTLTSSTPAVVSKSKTELTAVVTTTGPRSPTLRPPHQPSMSNAAGPSPVRGTAKALQQQPRIVGAKAVGGGVVTATTAATTAVPLPPSVSTAEATPHAKPSPAAVPEVAAVVAAGVTATEAAAPTAALPPKPKAAKIRQRRRRSVLDLLQDEAEEFTRSLIGSGSEGDVAPISDDSKPMTRAARRRSISAMAAASEKFQGPLTRRRRSMLVGAIPTPPAALEAASPAPPSTKTTKAANTEKATAARKRQKVEPVAAPSLNAATSVPPPSPLHTAAPPSNTAGDSETVPQSDEQGSVAAVPPPPLTPPRPHDTSDVDFSFTPTPEPTPSASSPMAPPSKGSPIPSLMTPLQTVAVPRMEGVGAPNTAAVQESFTPTPTPTPTPTSPSARRNAELTVGTPTKALFSSRSRNENPPSATRRYSARRCSDVNAPSSTNGTTSSSSSSSGPTASSSNTASTSTWGNATGAGSGGSSGRGMRGAGGSGRGDEDGDDDGSQRRQSKEEEREYRHSQQRLSSGAQQQNNARSAEDAAAADVDMEGEEDVLSPPTQDAMAVFGHLLPSHAAAKKGLVSGGPIEKLVNSRTVTGKVLGIPLQVLAHASQAVVDDSATQQRRDEEWESLLTLTTRIVEAEETLVRTDTAYATVLPGLVGAPELIEAHFGSPMARRERPRGDHWGSKLEEPQRHGGSEGKASSPRRRSNAAPADALGEEKRGGRGRQVCAAATHLPPNGRSKEGSPADDDLFSGIDDVHMSGDDADADADAQAGWRSSDDGAQPTAAASAAAAVRGALVSPDKPPGWRGSINGKRVRFCTFDFSTTDTHPEAPSTAAAVPCDEEKGTAAMVPPPQGTATDVMIMKLSAVHRACQHIAAMLHNTAEGLPGPVVAFLTLLRRLSHELLHVSVLQQTLSFQLHPTLLLASEILGRDYGDLAVSFLKDAVRAHWNNAQSLLAWDDPIVADCLGKAAAFYSTELALMLPIPAVQQEAVLTVLQDMPQGSRAASAVERRLPAPATLTVATATAASEAAAAAPKHFPFHQRLANLLSSAIRALLRQGFNPNIEALEYGDEGGMGLQPATDAAFDALLRSQGWVEMDAAEEAMEFNVDDLAAVVHHSLFALHKFKPLVTAFCASCDCLSAAPQAATPAAPGLSLGPRPVGPGVKPQWQELGEALQGIATALANSWTIDGAKGNGRSDAVLQQLQQCPVELLMDLLEYCDAHRFLCKLLSFDVVLQASNLPCNPWRRLRLYAAMVASCGCHEEAFLRPLANLTVLARELSAEEKGVEQLGNVCRLLVEKEVSAAKSQRGKKKGGKKHSSNRRGSLSAGRAQREKWAKGRLPGKKGLRRLSADCSDDERFGEEGEEGFDDVMEDGCGGGGGDSDSSLGGNAALLLRWRDAWQRYSDEAHPFDDDLLRLWEERMRYPNLARIHTSEGLASVMQF